MKEPSRLKIVHKVFTTYAGAIEMFNMLMLKRFLALLVLFSALITTKRLYPV